MSARESLRLITQARSQRLLMQSDLDEDYSVIALLSNS